MWDNGEVCDLNNLIDNAPGWQLGDARAINDIGQIAGIGALHGQPAAYLLTPVPEAGHLGLLLVPIILSLRKTW
jgi:hypothetical protein